MCSSGGAFCRSSSRTLPMAAIRGGPDEELYHLVRRERSRGFFAPTVVTRTSSAASPCRRRHGPSGRRRHPGKAAKRRMRSPSSKITRPDPTPMRSWCREVVTKTGCHSGEVSRRAQDVSNRPEFNDEERVEPERLTPEVAETYGRCRAG